MAARPPASGSSNPRSSGSVRVGVSGWRYEPWRGAFYPAGLRQDDELAYAAHRLPTIELNGSFYSLQTPSSYAAWYAATPPAFMFSVKAPRYLTHVLRLREAGKAIANFFASGVFELKEKFGPLLWQLPPFFRFDAALIEDFLAALPHDTEAALAIARKRDARMHGRARLAIDAVRPLRHALEVRHASFIDARFIELLRRYSVALVVADTGGRWPELLDVTADFVYLRLHGATELYQSRYTDMQLASWAGRVRAWAAGEEPAGGQRASEVTPPAAPRDVFCYFDNTDKLHAPDNARALLQLLGVDWSPSGGPQVGGGRRRALTAG
jgi:uncharacterized protein YecE (DUF72 family)